MAKQRRAPTYAELAGLARGEALQQLAASSPDDPAVTLRQIRAAADAAAHAKDAAGMAEFAIRYAQELTRLRDEGPLAAVSAGHLQRGLHLADLHAPQERTLWYLVMAWELFLASSIAPGMAVLEAVLRSGVRLSGRHAEYGVLLIHSLFSHVAFEVLPVTRQVLGPAEQAEFVRRLLEADRPAEAARVAEGIDDAGWREKSLQACATGQVAEMLGGERVRPSGDPTDSRRHALPIMMAPSIARLRSDTDRARLADALASMAAALFEQGERAAGVAVAEAALQRASNRVAVLDVLIAGHQFDRVAAALAQLETLPEREATAGRLLEARAAAGQDVLRQARELKTPELRDRVIAAAALHHASREAFDEARTTALNIESEIGRADALASLAERELSSGKSIAETLALGISNSGSSPRLMARFGVLQIRAGDGDDTLLAASHMLSGSDEVEAVVEAQLQVERFDDALATARRYASAEALPSLLARIAGARQAPELLAEAVEMRAGAPITDLIRLGGIANPRLALARADVTYEIGAALLEAGDLPAARAAFASALKNSPASVFAEGWRSLHTIAALQERAGDVEACRATLRAALAIIQKIPDTTAREAALGEAAMAQAEAGQGDMALDSLAFLPQHPPATVLQVASALARCGDADRFAALLVPAASQVHSAWQWSADLLRLHPAHAAAMARAVVPLLPA